MQMILFCFICIYIHAANDSFSSFGNVRISNGCIVQCVKSTINKGVSTIAWILSHTHTYRLIPKITQHYKYIFAQH